MARDAQRQFKSVLTGPISGKEHQFLHDLSMDKMVGAFIALAAETYILRDRVLTLETVLEAAGTIAPGAVDGFEDDPERAAARAEDARRFATRVLSELHRSDAPASNIGRKGRDLDG